MITSIFFKAVIVAGAIAQANAKISKIVNFGDSVSDTGNAAALTNNNGPIIPSSLYYKTRFTNGPNFLDLIVNKHSLELNNYATAGATTDDNVLAGWLGGKFQEPFRADGSIQPVPGVNKQIDAYIQSTETTNKENILYTVWVAGNDDYDRPLKNVTIPASTFAQAQRQGWQKLVDSAGAKNIIAVVPPPKDQFMIEYGLQMQLQAVEFAFKNPSVTFRLYEVPIVFATIVAGSGLFGFKHGTTEWCCQNCFTGTVNGSVCADPDSYMLCDEAGHPTAATHRILANVLDALIQVTYGYQNKCTRVTNSYSDPLSATQRKIQIDALKSYFNFYPFTDLALYSRSPFYELNIDITSLLDNIIQNDSITTEFMLHQEIRSTLNKLMDPHVSYLPKCFSQVYFRQAFFLGVVNSGLGLAGGNASIYIADVLGVDGASDGLWPTGLAKYRGWIVTKINGIDAVTYIQTIADEVYPLSKSPSSRFNSVLTHYQPLNTNTARMALYGGITLLTTRIYKGITNSITYSLLNPNSTDGAGQDVEIPWAGSMMNGLVQSDVFQDSDSYYQGYCTVANVQTTGVVNEWELGPFKLSHSPLHDVARIETPFFEDDDGDLSESLALHGIKASLLQNGHFVSFYTFKDFDRNQTAGVMLLHTFDPSIRDNSGAASRRTDLFMQEFTSGLRALQIAGIEKLVIDATSNDGGTLCLGYALAEYLFQKPPIFTQNDVRVTQQVELAYRLGESHESPQFDVTRLSTVASPTNTYNDTNGFIYPGSIFPPTDSRYSNRFTNYKECQQTLSDVLDDKVNVQLTMGGWDPKNVAVVSNGECGSTCAVFVRTLRNQYGIKTFTYGGSSQSTPFQPTSFEGGNVLTFTRILQDTQQLAVLDFPLPTIGQLPFWEAYFVVPGYDEQPEIPGEFTPHESEYLVTGVKSTDWVGVWGFVVNAMYKDGFSSEEVRRPVTW
ncbi:hypothetical protein HDU76_002710 [Blyttiomyces sp. JEL0837]|nr:hypothetical protein HDU76_002710 [Blyttiomyces sp. JEL0837]